MLTYSERVALFRSRLQSIASLVLMLSIVCSSAAHAQLKPCSYRVVQAPLDIDDPSYARWLMAKARELFARDVGCDPFITPEYSTEFFDYLGINFIFSYQLSKLNNDQIESLHEKVPADLYLQHKFNANTKILEFHFYKIVGPEEERSLIIEKVTQYDLSAEKNEPQTLSSAMKFFLLTIPNTISGGFYSNQHFHDLRHDYKTIHTKKRSALPDFVSSISLNKIENGSSFNLFDFRTSLFLSFQGIGVDEATTFVNTKNGSDTPKLDLQVYGGCPLVDASIFLHSPLGTTYGSVGIGPCVYFKRADNKERTLDVNGATRFTLGHRAFFTVRYYVFFEVKTLGYFRPIYKNYVTKIDSAGSSVLGMGWYFWDVESLFTGLLN